MRKTIVALCLALTGVFALTAAGCGGGGSKSAATTAAATTEATQTQTQATTTAAPPATTKATTTTSSLGGIASAANCKELTDLGQKFQAAFTGAANSQDLKKQAQLLKEFADRTPSDIRPDFEVVADYLTKVADAVGNVKVGSTPDPATLAKLQKLSTEIDQQKLTAAGQHISAWVQKNCHK